jgi:hypothetical protein
VSPANSPANSPAIRPGAMVTARFVAPWTGRGREPELRAALPHLVEVVEVCAAPADTDTDTGGPELVARMLTGALVRLPVAWCTPTGATARPRRPPVSTLQAQVEEAKRRGGGQW